MPNLASAKKALKQNQKNEALNRQYKNRIKSIKKDLKNAINKSDQKEIKSKLSLFFKAVDKASKKNILHQNTANRRKALAYKEATAKNTSSQER